MQLVEQNYQKAHLGYKVYQPHKFQVGGSNIFLFWDFAIMLLYIIIDRDLDIWPSDLVFNRYLVITKDHLWLIFGKATVNIFLDIAVTLLYISVGTCDLDITPSDLVFDR